MRNRMQFKSTQVVNAFPPLRGRSGGRLCFGRDQKTENAQTISGMLCTYQCNAGGGGGRAWGGDLIVFVVPGVGHLTDLALPGEGTFESFFARRGDI